MNGSRTVLKTATWLVLWLSLWAAPSASAQDDPAPDSELSAADVTLRLELLADDGELSAELPDDLRSKLRGLWSAVLEQLQALDVAQGNLDRWEEGRLAAAEAVLSQQQRAAAEVPAVGPQIPEDGELLDLETGLSAARYEQAELDLAREAIVAEQARRVERGRQIPGELAAVQQNLVALDVLEEPAGAAAELREARDALTRVSRQAGRLQFDAVSAERPYYDAEENLISLQLDGATRRRDVAVVAVLAWESALRDARKRASALAEAEARQEVEKVVDQPPLVRDLAGETEQHAVRRNEITELHAHAAEVLDALVQAQSRIDELSLASKEKIKVAGISNAVAVLLRKQRSELPEILSVVERQAELPQSSIEVELEVIDRRRDRATLGQRRETSVSEILRALDEVARVDGVAPLRGAERLELEGVIRGLLQSQHEGLSPLIVELNRYFTDLNAIEFARETLSATVDDYGRFIDEHILWVRSAPAVAFSDLSRAAKGFGTLLLPSIWATAGEALKGQLARRTVQVAWAGLLIVLLALMRPLARRQIRRVGEKLS
ncbi:MAG: potassium efflux system protein, partial [Pseudohongiellaceae bacterium]